MKLGNLALSHCIRFLKLERNKTFSKSLPTATFFTQGNIFILTVK